MRDETLLAGGTRVSTAVASVERAVARPGETRCDHDSAVGFEGRVAGDARREPCARIFVESKIYGCVVVAVFLENRCDATMLVVSRRRIEARAGVDLSILDDCV